MTFSAAWARLSRCVLRMRSPSVNFTPTRRFVRRLRRFRPRARHGRLQRALPFLPSPAANATLRNFYVFLAGLFISRDAALKARKDPFQMVSTSDKSDDVVLSEYRTPQSWGPDNRLMVGIHLGDAKHPHAGAWHELRKELQDNMDGETLANLEGVHVVLGQVCDEGDEGDKLWVAAFYDSVRKQVWLAPICFLPHPSYPATAGTR